MSYREDLDPTGEYADRLIDRAREDGHGLSERATGSNSRIVAGNAPARGDAGLLAESVLNLLPEAALESCASCLRWCDPDGMNMSPALNGLVCEGCFDEEMNLAEFQGAA